MYTEKRSIFVKTVSRSWKKLNITLALFYLLQWKKGKKKEKLIKINWNRVN